MLYNQNDIHSAEFRIKRDSIIGLAGGLLLVSLCIILFLRRGKPLCVSVSIITGWALVFFLDLYFIPDDSYCKWLKDLHSGLRRKTEGTLLKIEKEKVYEKHLCFREIMVNISEDNTGIIERRFLIDANKRIPIGMLNRRVSITSCESYVLDIEIKE